MGSGMDKRADEDRWHRRTTEKNEVWGRGQAPREVAGYSQRKELPEGQASEQRTQKAFSACALTSASYCCYVIS